jgi:Fe-Mn family superoxide dismutase
MKSFSKISDQKSDSDFVLPNLPYSKDAFQDFGISQESFDYHHGKHHNTYVVNLNNLLKDNSKYSNLSLEEVILKAYSEKNNPMFNNAAQVWNHTFFWHSITPLKTSMSKELEALIVKSFGSVDAFLSQFKASALAQFGSGWTWLIYEKGKLEIINTSNAGIPIVDNKLPLLNVDVWEHAYYIDFRNARAGYLDKFLSAINWEFASNNLEYAKSFE